MNVPSGRKCLFTRRIGAYALLLAACIVLAACNVFSMAGLLDTPPAGGASTTTGGGTTTGGPSALTLVPDAVNILVNGSRQFTATGGSGGYSYGMESGGAGGSIDASGLYSAPAAPGTDSVIVTDSTGTSCTATALVVAAMPLSLTPTSTSVDAGGTVTFTASGGSGSYNFSLMSGAGSLLGPAYTAAWAAGAATIRLTDAVTLDWREASVVVSAPTAVHISPSVITMDAHGSVTLSASGGSGSYVFTKDSGGGILAGPIYTATWSAESAAIRVTDSNTSAVDVCSITVNAPAALEINPSSASIYDTGSLTFTADGGSGNPVNYAFSVFSGLGSTAGPLYTPPGSATVAVIRVTDVATLQTSDATVTVTVPVGLAISPKSFAVNAGGSVIMTAGGGAAPYGYVKLSGSGTFVDNGDNTGTYTAPWATTDAAIQVTDTIPNTDVANIHVNAPPALAISPGATALNVGQPVTFTGSGGSGNPAFYSYSKISGSGTLVGATYTAPGSATTAVIRITDTRTLQTSNATVTVNAPPPLTLTPASSNVFAGDAVTFTPGGGSGSYSFSLVSGTGTLAGPTYTTVTAETSVIRLTDTVTLSTQNATVVAYFPLTIVPSSANVQTGDTYPFTASGGVPPYTYSVILGTGTINSSTGLFSAPLSAESDTVKVVDSVANASTASVTMQLAGPWTISAIDAAAKSGQFASLKLDGGGLPRIAYYESQLRELRYASWNGSAWSVQTVDTTNHVGQYLSLALASGTGYPRISYYDATNHDLKYASWSGTSWSTQTVASSGDVGMYTSLALDSGTGYPRISYYDKTNTNLKYAAWDGSSWSTQTIDSPGSVGLNTSLALEPGTNYPRIAYYKSSSHDLKFASWNGTTWVIQSIDSVGDVGMYTSIALEPGTNYPRISYYDNTNKNLKYASWNGASWALQTVASTGDVGMYTSLDLESGTFYPCISYYDNTNQDLDYATWNGTIWVFEIVDTTNNVGSYSSLALDPISHKPRIAYYDSSSQDLKYAAKP